MQTLTNYLSGKGIPGENEDCGKIAYFHFKCMKGPTERQSEKASDLNNSIKEECIKEKAQGTVCKSCVLAYRAVFNGSAG